MLLQLAAAIAALGLSAPAFALDVGDKAPCVTLETISPAGAAADQCIRTRAAAQRFTLIEFFSTTCSYCLENLPVIASLGADVAPTAQLRFVAIDRRRQDVVAYIAAHDQIAQFPVALDVTREAKRVYGVAVTPTVFVLDQNETVVFKHEGTLDSADVAAIKDLVD